MIIKEVSAKSILDSRKQPTIEVSINSSSASSPSGKSTGKYETPSYHKSLQWNIKAINSLKELIGLQINSFSDLAKVEALIKKKFNFSKPQNFGANALFSLESAILKALAKSLGLQLWQVINSKAKKIPCPVGNAVGGGLHSHNKNAPEFQEFLLIPNGKTFSQQFKNMNKAYLSIGKKLKSKTKDDEGAWQTSFSNEDILKTLSKESSIRIGLDIAGSSFYKFNEYVYYQKELNQSAQIHYINYLIKKYNLLYIEDPLEESDFQGFSKIIKSNNHFVVGDDLTVSHLARLKKAIDSKSINAMIVKPNQNGSLLEIKKVIDICKKSRIATIFSHRAGETLDTAIADYAFAFGCDFIKCGISTKWREAKLKRLVQIEKSLK